MHLDTVTEKAEPERPGPSRGSMFTHWPGRFRVALSRTRPYILAAAATYVGAVLVSFIVVFSLPEPVRDGLFSPGRRWLLRQPIVQQPLDLDVGFADWSYVFRHNVVADLLGIATAGLPGILINAYGLGESAAGFHAAGKGAIFWSLILPHGLLEVATFCVAWGVGLRFARSLLARMRHRADPLGGVRTALADGIVLVLGLVVPATAVAALIEVELTTMWMPLPLAILFGAFAAATFVALIFGISGPEPGTIAAERASVVDGRDAASAEEVPSEFPDAT
jgi:Stage II sporulation protein M